MSKLCMFDLVEFSHFHNQPQFTEVTGMNSRNNIPGAPRNILGTTNFLPGCGQCCCCGFKVGCGLVRLLRTHQDHENREEELRMSN